MATNGGFYSQQQQQQQQNVFQQPQNIYQQLGKPQPQPHLQGHPTYVQQQQQQQPIQSSGFQFAQQPQQAQPQQPYALTQTPYMLSQTPYQAPQTPYQPAQTPYQVPQTMYQPAQPQYIPAQTPFGAQVQNQVPYQLTQTPYNPSTSPYIQQQPYQQQQLVQYQQPPQQSQLQHIPTSSFPTHTQPLAQIQNQILNQTPPQSQHSAIGLTASTSGPGSAWRVSPKLPPVAPSATLAQQIPSPSQARISGLPRQQSQPPSPQQRQQPQPPPQLQSQPQQLQVQIPQTPSAVRRPLPQPSPSGQTRQSLPPPQRSQTLPPSSSGINGTGAMSPAVANAIAQLQKQTPQPLVQQRQGQSSPGTGQDQQSQLPPGAAAPKAFPRVQPQPIVTGTGVQASSTGSPSPTRGRPLPTPTRTESAVSSTPASTLAAANAKRMTVDMGRLPHGSSTIVPSLGGGRTSPTKPAGVFERRSMDSSASSNASAARGSPARLSRTSSYAIGATPSSPTKRRSSPPRFQAQTGRVSRNASPTKDSGATTIWGTDVLRAVGVGPPETGDEANATNAAPAAAATASASSSRSGNASNSTSSSAQAASTSSSSTTTAQTSSTIAPAKKFTPMWRRTIPEMPAPAWGYAAGMVAEPHPKPRAPTAPQAQAPVLTPKEQKKKEKEEKEQRKREEKEQKKREKEEAKAVRLQKKGKAPNVGASLGGSAQVPAHAQHQQVTGMTGYGQPVSAMQGRQQMALLALQQQQQQQQQQHYMMMQQRQQQQTAQYGHVRAPAGYAQPQNEAEEETEEDEEDEDEEDEEDESEEETEEEEDEEVEEQRQDRRYISSSRQYTQPLRSSSRPRYEERENTRSMASSTPSPKKRAAAAAVLRPKSAVDTSPIGMNDTRRRAGSEREYDTEYDYAHERDRDIYADLRGKSKQLVPKVKLSPSPNAKPKVRPKRDDERDRTPTKRRIVPRSESVGHMRSRSAFEDRDAELIRHRREASESEARARRRPGSAADRRRGMYDEEDDGDDDESIRLAYDDEEEEEEEEERWDVTPRRRSATGPNANATYGIRKFPPVTGRRWEAREDEYEYDEEPEGLPQRRPATADVERQREPGRLRNWNTQERNEGPRYHTGSTGLPQPPSMNRQSFTGGGPSGARSSPEKPARGGPRLKSAPLKYDDGEDEDNRRYTTGGVQEAQQDTNATHIKFTAAKVNNTSSSGQAHSRSESRGSAVGTSAGVWPVDLPRLPRTPGSGNTPGAVVEHAGGYFDAKPLAASNANFTPRSNTNPNTNFTPTPISNSNPNSTFHNRPPPQASGRTNLNLDDPPPRASIVRTPSPGPHGGYVLTPRRELPQPQGAPQEHGHSAEDNARVTADLARRRSLYSAASNANQRQQEVSVHQRPQTQVYGTTFGQVQGQLQQHQQQFHHQQHQPAHQQPQFSNQLDGNHGHLRHSRPQQTPAPPPTVGIESPHPIGGREKMADIPKLEEDSNDGSDNEHRQTPRRALPSRGSVPMIQVDAAPRPPSIPMINVNGSPNMNNTNVPMININGGGGGGGSVPMINVDPPMIHVDSGNGSSPRKQVFEVPGVSVSGPEFDDHHGGPSFTISGPEDHSQRSTPLHGHRMQQQPHSPSSQSQFAPHRTGGLICGGCHGAIIGRIVSAMGQRFHPSCFKCTVCNELLEHVSSYEHEGRPYCHLDYHENFAPRCYSCKTAIIEEQFISLDDPALGKRAYHTQHFFCSECGDPFLTPSGGLPTNSNGEMAVTGDGEFEGFTVYKGYPYCEACHVRLRLPKCKRCKRSIRDNDQAVEALGGKWCWGCFVCASCEKPFENPSFFQRDDQPYCEPCFSIILRNEI